ncbi:hypothetical protein D3C72_679650 [compost metagenome]
MDVRLGANLAQPVAAALRVEVDHAVHEPHEAAGQLDRALEGQIREGRAEAAGEVATAQGLDLGLGVGLAAHRHQRAPVGGELAGHGLLVEGGEDDALAVGELFRREEAGAALAHGQERLAVDGGLELEEEQVGVALAHEAQDLDVVANHLARDGQAAVEGDDRIEQAVTGQPLGDVVDAQIGGEEQIGLAGFDGDARRDAAAVEVPGARHDVVLGDDAPRGHRPGLAFDGEDAIDEHERLVGQAHAGGVGIDSREGLAEDLGDRATGVLEAGFTVHEQVGMNDERLPIGHLPTLTAMRQPRLGPLPLEGGGRVGVIARCNQSARRSAGHPHLRRIRGASSPLKGEGDVAGQQRFEELGLMGQESEVVFRLAAGQAQIGLVGLGRGGLGLSEGLEGRGGELEHGRQVGRRGRGEGGLLPVRLHRRGRLCHWLWLGRWAESRRGHRLAGRLGGGRGGSHGLRSDRC